MVSRPQLQEAIKLAISMTLFYAIALVANWDLPKYGALAIAVISLGATGASLHKGLLRILGTTVGLIVGLAVVAWFSQDPWGNLAFLSGWLVVIGYIMQGNRYVYAWFIAGFLPVILWASSYGAAAGAFNYATFRYLETAIGVALYTVVSIVFWRRTSGQALEAQCTAIFGKLHELFGYYRGGIRTGEIPGEAEASRAAALGAITKLTPTLDGAYSDTPVVIERKRAWERLRVEVRDLLDALDLWREGLADVSSEDLDGRAPGLAAALDTLEHRFNRIDELWRGRHGDATPGGGAADEDSKLLAPLALSPAPPRGDGPTEPFEHAALLGFIERLEDIDAASRELLRTVRVIVGRDPMAGSAREHRDRETAPIFDPIRLLTAVFPAVCFAIAYVFWILADPPPGPMVPGMAATFGMLLVMAPANATKLLVMFLGSLVFVVAPVYIFVMPRLSTGAELLTMIFAVTFAISLIGTKSPLVRTLALVLFVTVTGISNDQVYSFVGLLNGCLLFVLSLGIVAIVQGLTRPRRPERELSRDLRRFFAGCSRITEDLGATTGMPPREARARREHVYGAMVLTPLRRIPATVARLDAKTIDAKNARDLLDAVQSVAARMRTLELSRQRVEGTTSESVRSLGARLREAVHPRFEAWSRLEPAADLDETTAVRDLTRGLEHDLEDSETRADGGAEPTESTLTQVHAVLDCARGLIRSVVATQAAVRRIDWDSLNEARF